MKQLQQTTKFEKELPRMKRRGADLRILQQVVLSLLQGEPLPVKHRDHPLIGTWCAHRECHLSPDWLLIYRATGDSVRLERTGTHSDLFRDRSAGVPGRLATNIRPGDLAHAHRSGPLRCDLQ